MNTETFLDRIGAISIVKAYAPDKRYQMTVLEPVQKQYNHYRIQIYHKRLRRIVIITTLEEFFDIIIMYDELDKDVTLLK